MKRGRLKKSTSAATGKTIPVDRISSLPESVISQILSLLPTKFAVATSVLSKSWKLRWTTISTFDFDDRLWANRDWTQPKMKFEELVNSVFATHYGSIRELRLRWQNRNVQPVYLSVWLKAAIARHVRVLDLNASEGFEFNLPAGFYSCGTLEIVKLRGPIEIKLPHLVCLPKLVVLELMAVNFECDESAARLISACPVLKNLQIFQKHFHDDMSVCKIVSPKLKHLDVRFHQGCHCPECDLKVLIDTPSLENLVLTSSFVSNVTCVQRAMPIDHLEITAVDHEAHRLTGDGVAGLVQACGSVAVLKLQGYAIIALVRGTSPLPATFGNLTKLSLEFPHIHWVKVMDLIDRCNKLQVLDITANDENYRDVESGGKYWKIPVHIPHCFCSSLRYVCFHTFGGLEDEMAALKFFLENGVLIERVDLCWSLYVTSMSDNQMLNVLYEVTRFPRASSSCIVVVQD